MLPTDILSNRVAFSQPCNFTSSRFCKITECFIVFHWNKKKMKMLIAVALRIVKLKHCN